MALKEHINDFERRSGLQLDATILLEDEHVPFEVATNIYRIVQEALTNVAKHAAATRIAVELRYIDQGLRVAVEDDGQGFDLNHSADPQSLGLVGMRERARLIGGHLEIRSAPGQGTAIHLAVPLLPS